MIYIVIVAIVVIAILSIYAYFGGFSTVKVRTEVAGGEVIVYKEVKGTYKKTPDITNEIYYYLLNELGIETYKGIGIFYDNPKEVEKGKLRSESGCIIEAGDIERLNPDECKYRIQTLATDTVITAELPFKGTLSIFMGFIKVYPAIEEYARAQNMGNGPIIEIYDVLNKKIIYRKLTPIDRQKSSSQCDY